MEHGADIAGTPGDRDESLIAGRHGENELRAGLEIDLEITRTVRIVANGTHKQFTCYTPWVEAYLVSGRTEFRAHLNVLAGSVALGVDIVEAVLTAPPRQVPDTSRRFEGLCQPLVL